LCMLDIRASEYGLAGMKPCETVWKCEEYIPSERMPLSTLKWQPHPGRP
jgi:hypothetical protein